MKKKIKLRDMTVEQWDNYINKCLSRSCSECIFETVNCRGSENKKSWFNNKDLFSDKFLDQEVEIEEPDILDEVEKEYLSFVINPFRDKVISIKKLIYVCFNCRMIYFINIKVNNEFAILGFQNIELPYFQDNMYEGMNLNQEYTLEDLGLDKN